MKATKYIVTVLAVVCSLGAKAQYATTTYFMDGSTHALELNPAKDYDRKGYFSLPILGGMNIAMRGNLSLQDIVKPLPDGSGRLGTFLHPAFSSKEAMSGFNKNNKLLTDMKLNVLGIGFHAFGGFNTIGVNIRANAGMNLPYDLFDFMRNLESRDYSLTNMGMTTTAWAEVALGHSRNINDKLRVGAKAKVLLGVAHAKLNADNVNLKMSNPDQWTANADASMEVALAGFSFGTPDTDGNVQFDKMDVDTKKLGIGGVGVAFDLGAEYKPIDHLTVSANVLDLGFIKWKNVAVAENKGETAVIDGIEMGFYENNNVEDEFEDIADNLEKLYNIQQSSSTGKLRGLGATLNIGAEYELPVYDKLKFGFLSTTRIQGQYSWNEERLAVTLSPAKAFEIAVSGAVGTLGANWGASINIHPRGFNLSVGMDHWLGKVSKQMIPLKSNADFYFSLSHPIGKAK